MKTYSLTFKTFHGTWEHAVIQATSDQTAKVTVGMLFNKEHWCGFTLSDFLGNIIAF